MKGDFSRFGFDRKKRYRAVLMQQGRLQLDSDWNEQVQIADERSAMLLRGLVGHSGAPKGNAMELALRTNGLVLTPGTYYVDGLLLENDKAIPLPRQEGEGVFLYYLDAWTREVNAAEDSELVDSAIGLETTIRLKTEWKLRCEQLSKKASDEWRRSPNPKEFLENSKIESLAGMRLEGVRVELESALPWPPLRSGTMKLNSGSVEVKTEDNRLYRIEVHQADSEPVRFKWSYDNASVCAEVEGKVGGVYKLANDSAHLRDAFKGAAWIELCLPGEAGFLSKARLDEGTLVFEKGCPAEWNFKEGDAPAKVLIRRWEGVFPEEDSLTQKLGVQFESGEVGLYQSGDYWLILIREGKIQNWKPWETKGPEGVEHHFAALGVVDFSQRLPLLQPLGVQFDPLASPNLSKTGNLEVGGNATIGGTLTVRAVDGRHSTVDGPLVVGGDLTAEKAVKISGDTTLGSATASASDGRQLNIYASTNIGTSSVNRSVMVRGSITIRADGTTRPLTVYGNAAITGALTVSGPGTSSIVGPLNISGNTTLLGPTTLGSASAPQALTVHGPASISGAFTAQSTANMLGNTSIGTSKANKQLTVYGSAGISGAFVAASASILGNTTLGGALTVNGTGTSKVGGPLSVHGNLLMNGERAIVFNMYSQQTNSSGFARIFLDDPMTVDNSEIGDPEKYIPAIVSCATHPSNVSVGSCALGRYRLRLSDSLRASSLLNKTRWTVHFQASLAQVVTVSVGVLFLHRSLCAVGALPEVSTSVLEFVAVEELEGISMVEVSGRKVPVKELIAAEFVVKDTPLYELVRKTDELAQVEQLDNLTRFERIVELPLPK